MRKGWISFFFFIFFFGGGGEIRGDIIGKKTFSNGLMGCNF